MTEKIKFNRSEAEQKQKKTLDMNENTGKMIEQGTAEIYQKVIDKIEEKELKKLLEEKTKYCYENNIVVRFTNAAFLDDIFVTKKEFRGYGSIIMKPDNLRKYYTEGVRNNLPFSKDEANLGTLINEAYRIGNRDFIGITDLGKIKEQQKNRVWHWFILQQTDWEGTGGEKYASAFKTIYDRKNKELPLKSEQSGIDFHNLRKYLHAKSGISFNNKEWCTEELKKGSMVIRNYNIGVLISIEAVKKYEDYSFIGYIRFKQPTAIDIVRDLKGIICTIRDRVFEQKVIEEMIKLTEKNPEARVPVFDLDGNQIYPVRRKRKEIEEIIKQRTYAVGLI